MRKIHPLILGLIFTLLIGLLMMLTDQLFTNGASLWAELHTQEDTVFYFCETPALNDLFRHKINTYTNLAFLFIAIVMLTYWWRERKLKNGKFIQRHASWSLIFACAGIFIFLGSSFFHASLTRIAEWTDLAAVYAMTWIPVIFNLHRLACLQKQKDLNAGPFLVVFGILFLISSLLIFKIPSWYLVPSVLILIGGSAVIVQLRSRPATGWTWLMASMLCSGLAATLFSFDIQRIFCNPEGLFQMHGAWHIMAAAASGTFYGYMRIAHN